MEWQEELDKTFRRLANLHALVTKPEPKVGQTPREEVYKKNKSRLYRYTSSRRHATPLLFVPNLGISRPYIFDLLPGGRRSKMYGRLIPRFGTNRSGVAWRRDEVYR